MVKKKELYRNVFVVEVMSEDPISSNTEFEDIVHDMTFGELSGNVRTKIDNQLVKGRIAAKIVLAQGTDPQFFGMNEFGNEIEED